MKLHIFACASLVSLFFAAGARTPRQQSSAQQSSSSEKAGTPNQPAATDQKTRVYIADSTSWEVEGGWGAANGSGGGGTKGGARPQTAEIIKTFNERCPVLTVTNNKDKANYAVILDHEGGKSFLSHRNKIVVFNRDGDAIFSGSTLSLGNAVKDACTAISKDTGSKSK